ncbi:MAG: formyltransferase family protein [Gammaproteobacteria bacterium]|jgi:methionyl-tRNA formyltransferase
MKIAYCGYDFFSASLQKLLDNKFDVYRIFTVPCDNRFNYNQYIYQIARQHKIPVSEQKIDEKTIAQLQAEDCDLLITGAYFYKIPDLSATSIKGINIHPTLLPTGRGVWPLPWTILTRQRQTGVTIHQLTPEYDSGNILLQQSFPVAANERLESLSAKLQLTASDMLLDVVNHLDQYWRNAKPQSGEVSIWDYPNPQQRTLNWYDGIDEIDRICRAFGKFGCFARFDNQQWVVYGLIGWKQSHSYEPGIVIHKTNTEMIVAASDGLVSVLYFEPAVS